MESPALTTTSLETAPWPVSLVEVKPETLHQHWPFIERGLLHVVRRVKPDWIPNDIYSALFTGATSCVVASRNGRNLGFVVYYRDVRFFSKTPQLFIWAAYDLPFRERTNLDNLPDVVSTVWRYLTVVAKGNFGTSVISWITTASRAEAFRRKYRWLPRYATFQVDV